MSIISRHTVYNDIVNDEDYSIVNNNNKELLDDFVEYLESIGRSELTIVNYISDIKIYFIWNMKNAKNKDFVEITKRDVMKYQNWLINTLKVSSARIRRLRSAISSMSNFIENVLDDSFPDFRNIVGKIPAPINQPVREKTVFEDGDLDGLLQTLIEKEKFQEACALALAMYSGARKAELKRFKVNHFDDENIVHNSLYRTPEKIKTKGRGGKMLTKYVLVSGFKPYLDLWLKERNRLGIDNEYLLVRNLDNKWVQAQVSTLDSWAETFNKLIDKHFYWHSTRHFFTTSLAKANIPAEIIKEVIGWESVEMVSIYNDIGIDDELGKYFGEDGIKDVEQKDLKDL